MVEKLDSYFTAHKLVRYRKGEIIMKPGEKPGYIGFIKSGFVRMYTLSESGQEVTMQFFKPVFYFTMIYAYCKMENRFYMEAITPVEVYEAPVAETLEFFKKNYELARQVMDNVMKAFVDLVEQMGSMLSGNAYNRVAAMVLSLSNRTEKGDGNYDKIDFGITHKLIASLTGLTRETVTLQMLRLEKEKLIVNKSKKVEVVNKAELTKAAKMGNG